MTRPPAEPSRPDPVSPSIGVDWSSWFARAVFWAFAFLTGLGGGILFSLIVHGHAR